MSESVGTLYMYDPYHPGAHRALRILATAAVAKRTVDLAPDYVHKVTNKTPEFLAKFPSGLVPALETKDGNYISEGSAIALYIALLAPESGLIPEGPLGQAQVAQWQGFVDFSILSNLLFVYGSNAGFFAAPPATIKAKLNAAVDGLAKIDAYLANKVKEGRKAFLIGEGLTLADIAVVSGLVRGYGGVFDKTVQERYPTVFGYFQAILSIPEIKGVYGDSVKISETSPVKFTE